MLTEALLPRSKILEVNVVAVEDGVITLTIYCRKSGAPCPEYGGPSERVLSRYWRTVADLQCAEYRACCA